MMIKSSQIKNVIKEWCLSTTIHGLEPITKHQSFFWKSVWSICLIISISICSYLCLDTFLEFSKFHVQTNVEIINLDRIDFPVITICNQNPFNSSNNETRHFMLNKLTEKYSNYKEILKNNSPRLTTQIVMRYLKGIIVNLNDTEKRKHGYEINDMYISCNFNSGSCTRSNLRNFSWIYSFEYGNCFKFGSDTPILRTNKNGERGGLAMELYIGNSSSDELFITKRGLRILVQNRSENFGNLIDDGIDLEPGTFTKIAIKPTHFRRLSRPYGNCVEDLSIQNQYKTQIMDMMFKNLNIINYSKSICERYRYYFELLKTCNCSDPTFSRYVNISENGCFTPDQVRCSDDFFYNYSLSYVPSEEMECLPECFKIEYNIETSKSNYFTNWYLDLLKEYFSENNVKQRETSPISSYLVSKISNLEEAKRDVVAFNIYYDDISYTYISQTPALGINTLLSNIGGQIGLFLGMSLLSLVEIIELFFAIIQKLIYKPTKTLDFKS